MKKIILSLLVVMSLPAHSLTFYAESNPPFQYDVNGKVEGVSISVLQEISKRSGVAIDKLEIVPWNRALQSAETEKDVCALTGSPNAEREAKFKILAPLADNEWVLWGMNTFKTKITSIEDLKKAKIKIGAYNDSKLTYLKEQGVPESVFEVAPEDKLNPTKLSAGRMDLWIAGIYTGQDLFKAAGIKNFQKVFSVRKVKLHMLCNKGVSDEIAKKVMSAYDSMVADGSWKKLTTKAIKAQGYSM